MWPSSKVGPAMAGPTRPVLPGLYVQHVHHVLYRALSSLATTKFSDFVSWRLAATNFSDFNDFYLAFVRWNQILRKTVNFSDTKY